MSATRGGTGSKYETQTRTMRGEYAKAGQKEIPILRHARERIDSGPGWHGLPTCRSRRPPFGTRRSTNERRALRSAPRSAVSNSPLRLPHVPASKEVQSPGVQSAPAHEAIECPVAKVSCGEVVRITFDVLSFRLVSCNANIEERLSTLARCEMIRATFLQVSPIEHLLERRL